MNFLRKFSGKALKEKMAPFMAQYGKVTLYTYIVFSLGDLGAWYLLVSRGIDAKKLMTKLGMKVDEEKFKNPSTGGNFVIALILHKADIFVRLPVTLACVPVFARWFGRTKAVQGPAAKVAEKVTEKITKT